MSKKKVTAKATCPCFSIDISALIQTKTLTPGETQLVKRKLKQQLTEIVAKLPFAEVYPHEVNVR